MLSIADTMCFVLLLLLCFTSFWMKKFLGTSHDQQINKKCFNALRNCNCDKSVLLFILYVNNCWSSRVELTFIIPYRLLLLTSVFSIPEQRTFYKLFIVVLSFCNSDIHINHPFYVPVKWLPYTIRWSFISCLIFP